MLNGDGIRVVLWVSGCSRNCYMCQNPQTHDKNSGIKFDEDAMSELLMALKPDYIQGLTLSGGHPLEGYNVSEVERIVKRVKDEYPIKIYGFIPGMILITYILTNDTKEFFIILTLL